MKLAIAKEFQKDSKAGFNNCVGCIDGLLIWISKQSKHECELCDCGAKKFFCSRNNKFGLNLQAVCDARERFLDVSIEHPGATSNFLAFMTSTLKRMIETPGFLFPGKSNNKIIQIYLKSIFFIFRAYNFW